MTTEEMIKNTENYIAKLKNDLEKHPFMADMIEDAIKFQEEMLESYKKYVETEKKVGRPALGVTKKVSITLPEEVWESLDEMQKFSGCSSRSELMRRILTWVSERGLN